MSQSITYKNTLRWPLTIQRQSDGAFKVSTPALPGKSWVGKDEMEATRAATRGIHEAQGKRDMDTRPEWMKSSEWASEAAVDGESKPAWMRDVSLVGPKAAALNE